jgi:RNA polymerase sigma factor (sigma-70 family)
MTVDTERIQEYRELLLRRARGRLPPHQKLWASDLAQDALLEAQRQAMLRAELPPEEVRRWLLRCLRRVMANAFRDEHRARRDPRRVCPIETVPPAALATSRDAPGEAAARGELAEALKRAVDLLTEPQRLALALRFDAGLSYELIGEELGIDGPSAWYLVCRGLTKLRKSGLIALEEA